MLKICKKKAISKILDVLVIKTVVSLPYLRLLPTTVKLILSMSLAAYADKL
jgi:hypothetical protein